MKTERANSLNCSGSRLTRRGFLHLAVGGVGVTLLAACGQQQPAAPAAAKATEAPVKPATAPTAPAAAPAVPPAAASKPTEAANPAAAAAKPATGPQRVTIAYGTELDVTGPYAHSTTEGYSTWKHVMEGLVRFDEQKGSYQPLLAESWENPSPTVWRFRLRKGVKFQDGSEFSAQDVLHSFNRLLNDATSKQAPQVKAVVKTITAVDPFTVDIETPIVLAPMLVQIHQRLITSKAAYDQYGANSERSLVGTGPFMFKELVPAQRFVVTKNPNYWGKPADVDEVVFRGIQDPAARVTALRNGEVDVIDSVLPELLPQLSGNVRLESVPSLLNLFLVINPIEEPLKDVRVRRAINHAIDRKALVEGVLAGQAEVLNNPVGTPFLGYEPKPKVTYEYDPDKAKALLAEAGYPNGFKIEQWTMTDRYVKDKQVSEAITAMLKKVGIDATLKSAEWSTYFGDYIANGKMPLYLTERGDAIDPSPYLHQYFRAGVSKRIVGFSSPKVDELLLKEASTLDPEKRIVALHDAMNAIMEEAPAVFLYLLKDNYGVSNRIEWKPFSENNNPWAYYMRIK